MLVLCRKSQEKIQVGENIVITVLQIKGNTVRLGIEAPRDVHVLRTELSITPDQFVAQPTEAHLPRNEKMPVKLPVKKSATMPAARPLNRLRRWPAVLPPLPAPKG
ncbi:MAG: carbon storage regulator [Planctomycetes bacterium]|nr:carbon storage regulator [Planctomycetota bacterium]